MARARTDARRFEWFEMLCVRFMSDFQIFESHNEQRGRWKYPREGHIPVKVTLDVLKAQIELMAVRIFAEKGGFTYSRKYGGTSSQFDPEGLLEALATKGCLELFDRKPSECELGRCDCAWQDTECYSCLKCSQEYDVHCFTGDGLVTMAAGGPPLQVRAIRRGDAVQTDYGAALVQCVVQTTVSKEMAMVQMPDGLVLTPNHPVRIRGVWMPAAEAGGLVVQHVDVLYNFVLSTGHVMRVDGVECVTLAHGFSDPGVAHEYWGTSAVLEDLRAHRGWGSGLVQYSGCICGEMNRTAGEKQQQQVLACILEKGPLVLDSDVLIGIHKGAMKMSGIESEFRDGPVTIGTAGHLAADPADIDVQVSQYCDQTNQMMDDTQFSAFEVGAFCLWWVNALHPFNDGNGRTARGVAVAVASSVLRHRDGILNARVVDGVHDIFHTPTIRQEYIRGLQHANRACGQCQCCSDGSARGCVGWKDVNSSLNQLVFKCFESVPCQ